MATTTKTAPKADAKVEQAQRLLNAHGFPCGTPDGIAGPKTAAAVRRFQAAFAGGRKRLADLAVDGKLGAKTHRALAELPYLSPHFTTHELDSRGDGTCYVSRHLVHALEQLRDAIGEPLVIVSACRDREHNRRVGGASGSMHVPWDESGAFAADIRARNEAKLRIERVLAVGQFSGIGDRAGIVRHVDVRHLAGKRNRTPDATPERPARWHY